MTSTARLLACVALVGAWGSATRAAAWELFRSENAEVRAGNEHLEKGQVDEALNAFNQAAKRLPNDPGVHLDRGLALLKLDKLGEAREAFRNAAQGSAPNDIRASAHYNLGLTFMREADELASHEDLEGAQKLMREAVDAFKGALRAQPKDRDAAWNLELAQRRVVDLKQKDEEKKRQEQEKKQQEEQQEQDKQDNDPNADPQDGDQNGDDSQNPSPDAKPNDAEDGEPKSDQESGADEQSDAGAPSEPEQADAGQGAEPSEPEQTPPPNAGQTDDSAQSEPQPALPEHMQKALDALEDGEENLQKHRAAMQARQRPRRVEKDW